MVSLSKRVIDAKEPGPRDTFLWDDQVRGFGLKVTPAGRKVFILQYRIAGRGTPQRHTIGLHGDLTPAQARQIAADLKHQVSKGIDPRETKIKKAIERKRQADPANSVAGLIDLFAAKHLINLKSGQDVKRLLDREVRPILGSKATTLVNRRDMVNLLENIEERAGPYARNHATAAVRKMYNWAASRDPDLPNPTVGLAMNPVTERDRVLSDEEIKQIWVGSDQLISIFCPFLKLLLLTAQRRSEVAGMAWSELGDLNKAVWTIPSNRTKNGLAHEVPLSGMALSIIRQIPKIGPFVFTTDGKTSISGFSKFKHNLDAVISATKLSTSQIDRNDNGIATIQHWTLHDLRRTAATIMAKLAVAPHVVERLLNHVSGTISGVAKIYNRHDYWEKRRQAFESLADYVLKVVSL